jgi:hypothetical protein
MTNLAAGWIGVLFGFLAGAIEGLFFYREDWRGGYTTWRRRMTRLAHISFFGIGFINIAFGLTIISIGFSPPPTVSIILMIGAAAMPLICYLSAWKDFFRHLFFIPVLCLVAGVSYLISGGLLK